MKTRFKHGKIFKKTKAAKAKWLLLLVFVLLFALVATTSAQEDDVAVDPDPPVPEPIIEIGSATPKGVNVQATFFAIKDTFLSSANPNNPNYGSWTTIRAGYSAAGFQAMRMIIEFNLSPIPSNSVVSSATMSFYQTQSVPSNDINMGLQAQFMKSPWSETSVTWNNANYLGGDIIGIGDNTNSLGWKTVDVTNVVREWVSRSRTNYGFIVTGMEDPQANRSRTFYSRQKAGFQPRMTVIYDQTCDNVAPTAWVENLPKFSQDSFKVKWTGTDSAPPGCTPVGIAYYDVQYSINGGSYTDWQTNNTGTSATFTGGQNGQTYYFRARGVDKAGNVQAWTGAQTQTIVDTQHPEASVLPLAQFTFGPNFTVNWDGQDNAGGSGIANYGTQFREGDGPWQTWLTATTAKSAIFTGAKNGVTYEFKARATDNVGNVQPWPDDAQAFTIVVNHPVALVLPFDPVILGPTAPITDSFEVAWIGYPVPVVPISGYTVAWRFNNGSWTEKNFNANTTEWTFDIPIGNPDGTYYFEAAALSGVGSDGLSGTYEAFKVVDLEPPFISVQQYLPIILNNNE